MSYEDVLKFQKNIANTYKYKALPPLYRAEALRFYELRLPPEFSVKGADVPLFSPEGLKICSRYNRVVIGDYGAYIEILPEDIEHSNLKVKEGQEYRDFDARYSNAKYSWLTTKDNSDMKIYFQKKEVDYADYVPGRYYVSPYECVPALFMSRAGEEVSVPRSAIAGWLKKHKVFSAKLLNYFDSLSQLHGGAVQGAIANNLFPGNVEKWVKLNEVCNMPGGLSFEQFSAVQYNLEVIGASDSELSGFLDYLHEDVRTAIKMGLDGLAFPYEISSCSPDVIRSLLKLPFDSLMDVSRFSKLVAGCKCEGHRWGELGHFVRSEGDVSEPLEEKITSAAVVAGLQGSVSLGFESLDNR